MRSTEGNSPVADVVRPRTAAENRSLTTSATNHREPCRDFGKWRFAVAVGLVVFAFASPVFAAEPAPAWLSEMAAYIKSLDANHLVADTRHVSGQPLLDDPNIDLYTRHYYSSIDTWAATTRKEIASLKGQRPYFDGEFGPYINGRDLTHDNLVAKTREFLQFVCDTPGMSGAMLWSMYFHHQDGGFYWHQIMTYPAVWSYHWPGFPSAEAQREIGLMATASPLSHCEGRS